MEKLPRGTDDIAEANFEAHFVDCVDKYRDLIDRQPVGPLRTLARCTHTLDIFTGMIWCYANERETTAVWLYNFHAVRSAIMRLLTALTESTDVDLHRTCMRDVGNTGSYRRWLRMYGRIAPKPATLRADLDEFRQALAAYSMALGDAPSRPQ